MEKNKTYEKIKKALDLYDQYKIKCNNLSKPNLSELEDKLLDNTLSVKEMKSLYFALRDELFDDFVLENENVYHTILYRIGQNYNKYLDSELEQLEEDLRAIRRGE